jgi:hypothetical protein
MTTQIKKHNYLNPPYKVNSPIFSTTGTILCAIVNTMLGNLPVCVTDTKIGKYRQPMHFFFLLTNILLFFLATFVKKVV